MTQSETEKNSQACKSHRHNISFPSAGAHFLFWPLVAAGVIADLWSKTAVFAWLESKPYCESCVIDGFLQLVRRENAGAAFSIAQGRTTMLIIVSIVALIAVVGIFLFAAARQKTMQIALALFTAGVLGNLYDRIFNDGLVRDFIDVYYGNYHWPAFNLADSMLCIAVGLLIISNITSASCQKPAQQQKEERQAPQ